MSRLTQNARWMAAVLPLVCAVALAVPANAQTLPPLPNSPATPA